MKLKLGGLCPPQQCKSFTSYFAVLDIIHLILIILNASYLLHTFGVLKTARFTTKNLSYVCQLYVSAKQILGNKCVLVFIKLIK